MGRRRERRQGTSRRVKIDLSVEEEQQPSSSPPPHLAIDPVNCKAEQDQAHQNSDGHTSPPSNSGVQENPLSLLGQYSDDEAEDNTVTNSKIDDVKVDEKKMDARVADFIAELETSGLLDAKESTMSDEFQESVREGPSEVVELEERPKEKLNTTSLASMIGDVVQKVLAENEAENCNWKAVLHEESGEYFYWNVVTGATTWDKPEGAVELAIGYSTPPLPSEAYGKEGEYQGLQDNYATADPGYVNSGEAQVQELTIGDQFSTEPVDIAAVIQVGETISNRLKVLCGDALLLLPENVRLAIEADVRLSDCRSLAAQGSVDGLFWSHADAHIKRLESILASQETAMVNQDEQKQAVNSGSTERFYQTEDVDMEVDMEIDDSHELPAPPDDWVPPLPLEPEIAPVPPPEEPPTSSLTSELTTSEHPLSDSNGDLRMSIEQPSGVETNTATSSGSSIPSIAGVKSSAPEVTPIRVSTNSAVLVEAAAAAAKKASKVVRTKKRSTGVPVSAPLKANKKVSSLVNKWIAAKEELHESEDEDEKALYDPEALERKRQREIEDWRREQIASGQALDNANFQPLGPVDWRERVKRARKEDKTKKSTSTGKQCPNLELLSRDLAPGWKAYWDESSGDVYYGNLATSETTWDMPAA